MEAPHQSWVVGAGAGYTADATSTDAPAARGIEVAPDSGVTAACQDDARQAETKA